MSVAGGGTVACATQVMLALAPALLALAPPTPIAIYTSDLCIGHNPGSRGKEVHPERPERLARLLDAARNDWKPSFGELLQMRGPPDADVTEEQLLRVHTPAHLARVRQAFANSQRPPGVRVNLDADTVISIGSEVAAMRAAGLVVAAVDEVFRGCAEGECAADAIRRAFVMVRPPGHHAEANKPMGFCVFNNVMVGVAHAQAVHGVGKVAVMDFDVHHGNGDADICWDRADCLYASSHQAPHYPHTGDQPVDGPHAQIFNALLPAGSGSEDFRAAWRDNLIPKIAAFKPEAIFLSAGFDAHSDDPLASIELTDDDFRWVTRELAAIGGGNLPLISVLEGGYDVDQLERSAKAHVDALIHG